MTSDLLIRRPPGPAWVTDDMSWISVCLDAASVDGPWILDDFVRSRKCATRSRPRALILGRQAPVEVITSPGPAAQTEEEPARRKRARRVRCRQAPQHGRAHAATS